MNVIEALAKNECTEQVLETKINEGIDILYYMNDIFEQDLPEFTLKLSAAFITTLFPVLMGSVIQDSPRPFHISLKLSLTIIMQILSIIHTPAVLDAICLALLSTVIPRNLLEICCNPPANFSRVDWEIDTVDTVQNPISQSFFGIFMSGIGGINAKKDQNEKLLAVMVVQGMLGNSAISKEVLGKIGLLSQKYCRKQELLSGILGTAGINEEYNEALIGSMLNMLVSGENLGFLIHHVVFKILYELTCITIPRICEVHEKLVRKLMHEIIIKLKELWDIDFFCKVIVEIFDIEWDFINKLNFITSPTLSSFKFLISQTRDPKGDFFLRKQSADNAGMNRDPDNIHIYLRIFFLIRKYLQVLGRKPPDEYPIQYSTSYYGLSINKLIDTSTLYLGSFHSVEVQYNNTKALVPDIDDYFLIIQPLSADVAKVLEIAKWKDLKVSHDYPNSTFVITIKRHTNSKITLKMPKETDHYSFFSSLQQRIQYALSLEKELIESFFEDTSGKIIGNYSI